MIRHFCDRCGVELGDGQGVFGNGGDTFDDTHEGSRFRVMVTAANSHDFCVKCVADLVRGRPLVRVAEIEAKL